MSSEQITIETSAGKAEAVRRSTNEDWEIITPWSKYFFIGTRAEAQQELRRHVKLHDH